MTKFMERFKTLLPIIGLAALGLGAGVVFAVASGRNSVASVPTPIPTQTVSTVQAVPEVTRSEAPVTHKVATVSPRAKASAVANSVRLTRTSNRDMQWGVTLRPFPSPDMDKNRALLPKQFDLMQQLGLNVVRTDYSNEDPWMNDLVMAEAAKRNMEVIFIIPFGPNDIRKDPKLYDNAYRYVYDIVKKYKGKVKIWQLATEAATVALKKPDMHGIEVADYPDETYRSVAVWMQAATRATKDADPAAKRMLNDQWTHVGFFKKFIAEGGQFEIIGWNWFSDMGGSDRMEQLLIENDPKRKFRLMDTLKSFDKEIWIAEINRRHGSEDGNQKAAADFIEQIANYGLKNTSIRGFLVFLLIGEQGYGLADVNYEAAQVSAITQAFDRYKAVIAKSRQ